MCEDQSVGGGVAELTVFAQKLSAVTQKECCHDEWVVPFKGIARQKQ